MTAFNKWRVIATLLLALSPTLCACNQLAVKSGLISDRDNSYRQYDETAWNEALAQEQKMRLFNNLEAYYLLYGHYPLDLSELVESGIAEPWEITSPLGAGFSYNRLNIQKPHSVMNKNSSVSWTLDTNY